MFVCFTFVSSVIDLLDSKQLVLLHFYAGMFSAFVAKILSFREMIRLP